MKLLFFLGSVWAVPCSTIGRHPLLMPDSYTDTQPANLNTYFQIESSRLHLNAAVPPLCEDVIRVVTFNIHYFQDDAKKNTTKQILAEIARLEATVLILQEVSSLSYPARRTFDAEMTKLGYQFQEEGIDGALANVIYSRLPLQNPVVTKLGHTRTLVEAQVGVDGEIYTIYGTHLHNGGGFNNQGIRTVQARKIMTRVTQPNAILMGDMNALVGSTAIQEFTQTLVDSFKALSWPPPAYTCWGGTTIDFLFVSPQLTPKLLGAYLYHTLASDHLPVVLDLQMSKASQQKAMLPVAPPPPPPPPPTPAKPTSSPSSSSSSGPSSSSSSSSNSNSTPGPTPSPRPSTPRPPSKKNDAGTIIRLPIWLLCISLLVYL